MCCGVISALSVILAVSIPAVAILPPIPLRLSSLPHLAVAIVVVTIPAVAIPAVAIPAVVVGWWGWRVVCGGEVSIRTCIGACMPRRKKEFRREKEGEGVDISIAE